MSTVVCKLLLWLQELQEKLAQIDEDRRHNEAMRSQLSTVNQLQRENQRLRDDVTVFK